MFDVVERDEKIFRSFHPCNQLTDLKNSKTVIVRGGERMVIGAP